MLDALALTEATKKHLVDDNNNNNDDDVSVCSMGVDAVLSSSTSCSCQDTDWQKTSLILWPHDVFKTLFDAGPAVFFDRLGTPDQWEEYRHFAFLSLGKTTTFPMFPRFPDLFGLSWETSTFKHYHPEASKHSGSRRIEFSSESTTFSM